MTNTITKQRIIPHLWIEKDAKEAARFYTSIFPESTLDHLTVLPDTPGGDTDLVSFRIWGQPFVAFGPNAYCQPNPSVSFFVNYDPLFFGKEADPKKAALDKLNQAWEKLSAGGKVLMPIDKYFFSERYGWIQDKFGVSWQLILPHPEGEKRPPISPSLLFTGKNAGRAEEAIKFYLSVFRDSKMGQAHRYGPGQAPDKEDSLAFADFMIEKTWVAAMDSAREHNFEFNEGVSLLVECADQKEMDYFSDKLSAVPEAEQCGWIKDKFGVSWQIAPAVMSQMMTEGTPEQVKRVLQAFMPMKRYDLKTLEKAYGRG